MPITRRGLLMAGGLGAGGLFLGVTGLATYASTFDARSLQKAVVDPASLRMVAQWITIDPDGTVTLLGPHTEMGQGIQTGLLQILLDELDADPSTTAYQLAPPDPAFATGEALAGLVTEGHDLRGWAGALVSGTFSRVTQLGELMFTGGSSAVRFTGWRGIRRAAASARMMLAEAGATHLGVPVAEVTTRLGEVVHPSTGARVGYGTIAAAAAALPLPEDPLYKAVEDYVFIGTTMPRADLPPKVFGAPVYGIDVDVPNLRYAAIAPPPMAQGTVTGVRNEADVLARRGVEAVVPMDDAVAVVADNPWRAEQAARVLEIDADPPNGGPLDHAALREQRRAAVRNDAWVLRWRGAGRGTLTGDDVIEAEYHTPYLVHAPMEPLNATVWTEGDTVHVATGTQGPLATKNAAAAVLGRPADQVVLHTHMLGGSFGRRNTLVPDSLNWVRTACRVHNAVGGAVKTTWSREASMRMSGYHPADVGLMQARLGPDGTPTDWVTRVYAAPISPTEATPWYAVPNLSVQSVRGTPALPYGFWRSVAHFTNTFFIESFVDELADAAGTDPVAYRRSLLPMGGREERVLSRVAEMSGWTGRTRGDRGYGVAYAECFGSLVALVLEVSMHGPVPRVHHAWCALDCGIPVNPDTVEAQVQGGLFWGLSAALYGAIEFDEAGAILQDNFHTYRVATFADAPRIEVDLLWSPDAPIGGVGEVSTPVAAPALANAMAALGQRPRAMPFVRS